MEAQNIAIIIRRSPATTASSSSSFKLETKNHMQMRKMSSTQISHHASKANGAAATTTNALAHNSCQYVVSRNGIILPWKQIHQQYRRVVQDDDNDDTDYSSTAFSNQQQQQQLNDYNINNDDENNNTPLDSNKLLQLLPRGAYTTCRTVRGGTHIYQFDYHVRRLANSAKSILGEVQQQQQSASSSDVDDGRSSDGDEAKERLGDTNHQASTSPLELTSNHPIQHDRQLSSFEITQLNITNVVWEHDMALKCIRNTLREFCTCYGVCLWDDVGVGGDDDDKAEEDEKVEFKITLLATWEKKNKKVIPSTHDINSDAAYESALYCHVGLLKPKKTDHAATTTTTSSSSTKTLQQKRVLIHGHGRENALAKDSKWVLDREKLTKPSIDNDEKSENNEENLHHQPFEEIILINDDGELLEGTQTNFYVVSGMSIITANEGILYGSVRDSVLRACRYHNIPVELRPPTLKDLKSASGVFISSTSRWVMPIHEVCLGDLLSFQNEDNEEEEEVEEEERSESVDMNTNKGKRNGKSYFYGNCKITEDIRRWVLEDVESRSTPLFETE